MLTQILALCAEVQQTLVSMQDNNLLLVNG